MKRGKEMKLFLAVAGLPGAGKSHFGRVLSELLGENKIGTIRTSFFLQKILFVMGRDFTRPNCDKLVTAIASGFGEDWLTGCVHRSLDQFPEKEVIIFDGARLKSDFDCVRNHSCGKVVLLSASQDVRYQRVLQRKSDDGKAGENLISFEQFLQMDNGTQEQYVQELVRDPSKVDLVINNEKDIDHLREQVGRMLQNWSILSDQTSLT